MTSSNRGPHEVIVAESDDEMAALAAELCARAIHGAVTERGVARIALSGGTTPTNTYLRLAELDLPWDRTEWFWVDERAVAPTSPRSNHRSAAEALRLRPGDGRVAPARVHRMEADDADLAAAASRYEQALRCSFGVAASIAFDVMTLGVGDDGHTASLFPGEGTVGIDDRLVLAAPAQPDKGLEARVTMTSPVLCQARLALVLSRGTSKRIPVQRARERGPEDEVPARLLQRAEGRVVWLLDRAAAGDAA